MTCRLNSTADAESDVRPILIPARPSAATPRLPVSNVNKTVFAHGTSLTAAYKCDGNRTRTWGDAAQALTSDYRVLCSDWRPSAVKAIVAVVEGGLGFALRICASRAAMLAALSGGWLLIKMHTPQ